MSTKSEWGRGATKSEHHKHHEWVGKNNIKSEQQEHQEPIGKRSIKSEHVRGAPRTSREEERSGMRKEEE
jgi:hypothetical protein